MDLAAFPVTGTKVDAIAIALFVRSASVTAALLVGVTNQQENLRQLYWCFISSLLLGTFSYLSGA